MVDRAVIAEARRALGRQLAAYREAAGLNQHQLAPLVHYGRSTIANAETGHSTCSRVFWERCDEALHAGGALVRGYHDLQAAGRAERAQVAEHAEAERAALLRGLTDHQSASASDGLVAVPVDAPPAGASASGAPPGSGADRIVLRLKHDGADVVLPLSRRVL
ncbi:MAG TPA: helix-turn-helix transcriptional regulator [Kribbellaceae bacterium]|jgi:DNA-binding XRE family transcriptional regulator